MCAGFDATDGRRSASNRRGNQQRAGFDPVGNDAIRRAVQSIDAVDFERVRAQAGYPGPQRDEEAAEIDDFGFLRCRLDDRAAAGQRGGAQHVGRAGDGRPARTAQIDGRAAQPRGAGDDVAVGNANLGAQGGQARQVQIDGPRADVAAAGERNHGPAPPRQQRPQHAEAGAHAADQFVVGAGRRGVKRGNVQRRRRAGVLLRRPSGPAGTPAC